MNDIKFICHDKNVLKNFPIVPAKDCIPDWYEKLEDKNSIVNDMPARDYITALRGVSIGIYTMHLNKQ